MQRQITEHINTFFFQLTFFKELGSLDTILRQLKEKWNQKPKHAAKFYCIQTLHIY